MVITDEYLLDVRHVLDNDSIDNEMLREHLEILLDAVSEFRRLQREEEEIARGLVICPQGYEHYFPLMDLEFPHLHP